MPFVYPVSTGHNHDEIYLKKGEGGGGVTDHGELTGLSDNDHPQYSLTTHDHDSDYLGITAKAADSDKLDGQDSTSFSPATHNHDPDYSAIGHDHNFDYSAIGHNHDLDYLGILGKAADSDKLDGQDSTAFSPATHDHDSDYSAIGHDHDSDYSAIGHNHDLDYLGLLAQANDSASLGGVRADEYSRTTHDHDADYLGITAKAADSDKLDGIDSTGFATVGHDHDADYSAIGHDHDGDYSAIGHDHDGDYLGITAKAADSDKLDGIDSTGFALANHEHNTFSTSKFVQLANPLSSNSWTIGVASHSTTSPTLLDLSSVFNAPAGVKAVYVRLVARDSATLHNTGLYVALGPSAARFYELSVHPPGGDVQVSTGGIVNCNSNGDIYYAINASGTNTMDVQLEIWGYWIEEFGTSVGDAWQDWIPTVTGWAAGYTINTARYKLIGKTCFFSVDISGTSNSSANIAITLPFTSYSGAGSPVWGGTNAYQVDNGVVSTTPGRWSIGENSGTLYAVKNMATGAWTASGTKRIRITGFYEVE